MARWLGWLFVGAVALALGWLLLLNVALWTGLVAWAVTGERERVTLELQHGFAWCVWPTRVHLSDFDLRIETHGWQMAIAADSATVDLGFLQLLSRRFTADHVALSGLNLTFRAKRDEGRSDDFAHWGPIAGFDDPVRVGERPPPPEPDKAWAIDLPHMDADLDRLWINGVRTEMRGELSTGVFAVASNMYGIAPTQIRVDEGIVFVGDEMATTSLEGRIAVTVAPYPHREVEGADVLRQISALVELDADLTGARALRSLLPQKAPVLRGGGGPISIDLAMWSGVVTEGEVKYRTGSIVAALEQATIRAALALDVEIGGDRPRAQASLSLRKLSGSTPDGKEPWWRAQSVAADATFTHLDLSAGRPRVHSASMAVPGIELLDLGNLGDIGKATLRGGHGEISLRAAYDREEGVTGHIGATVREVDVSTKGARVRADVRVTTDVRANPDLDRVALHPLALRVDDVAIASDRGRADEFWARVGAGRVRWDRDAGRFDIDLIGEIDDLAPVLAQARASSNMADVLQDLENLELRQPIQFDAHATIAGDTIDVRLDRAERPTLELSGRWRRVGKQTRAAFLLGRLKVGLVKSGKARWNPELSVGEDWLRKRERWVGQL